MCHGSHRRDDIRPRIATQCLGMNNWQQTDAASKGEKLKNVLCAERTLKSLERITIYDSSILSIIFRFSVDLNTFLAVLHVQSSDLADQAPALATNSGHFAKNWIHLGRSATSCMEKSHPVYTISTNSNRNHHDKLRLRKLLCTLRLSFALPALNTIYEFFGRMSNEAIDVLIVRRPQTVHKCCEAPNRWCWRRMQICLRITSNESIASPSSMIAFVLSAQNVMPKLRHVFGRNHFNLFIFISRSWGQGMLSRLVYGIIVTAEWYNGDERIQKRKNIHVVPGDSRRRHSSDEWWLVSGKHPAEICKWSCNVCFQFIHNPKSGQKKMRVPLLVAGKVEPRSDICSRRLHWY